MRIEGRTADLAAGFAALNRVVQVHRGRERFSHVSVTATDSGIRCFHAGHVLEVGMSVDAAVSGSATFRVPIRLIADVVRAVDEDRIEMEWTGEELQVRAARSRFAIQGQAEEPRSFREVSWSGCSLERRRYLYAFKRVAIATLGGQTGHEEVPVVLSQRDGVISIRFDTFDVAAIDAAPVSRGEFGETVAVRADAFYAIVNQLTPRYPSLELGSHSGKRFWVRAEHERHRYVLELATGLWGGTVRDAEALAPQTVTRRATISGRRLRAAMKHVALGFWRRTTGLYVTLHFEPARNTVRISTHGWFAAAAEEIACQFQEGGDAFEITLEFNDLWFAARHVRGGLVVSIGDPSHPVELSDGADYRCLLRTLPSSDDRHAPHAGFADNIPFPNVASVVK